MKIYGIVMIETFYVHLEFQTKTGSWSVNLPFLCAKCGVCCTLEDFLTAGEIHKSPVVSQEAYGKFEALTAELGKMFEQSEERDMSGTLHILDVPFRQRMFVPFMRLGQMGVDNFPIQCLVCYLKTVKHLSVLKNKK
jgi:hypothetical protein